MQGYIDEIKNIIETMPHNEFIDRLIKAIGPFYEFVDEDNTIQNETNSDDNDEENDEEENEIEIASINSAKRINGMNLSQTSNGMTNSYDMMTSATFNNKSGLDTNENSNLNNGTLLNGKTNGVELNKSILTNSDDFLNKNDGEKLQNGIPINVNRSDLNGKGSNNNPTGKKCENC
jgi:hypothetical protein